MNYTEKRLEFREKLREIMIWIKVQPHEDYTDAIVELFDTSIHQALAEEREKVVGYITDEEELLKVSKNGAEEVIMNLRTRISSLDKLTDK